MLLHVKPEGILPGGWGAVMALGNHILVLGLGLFYATGTNLIFS